MLICSPIFIKAQRLGHVDILAFLHLNEPTWFVSYFCWMMGTEPAWEISRVLTRNGEIATSRISASVGPLNVKYACMLGTRA
jgi:hypothetical protein